MEQEVLWLRLRVLMLRALALAFSLLPSPLEDERAVNNGASNEHLSPMEEVITELAEVLDMADKHPGTRETLPPLGPPCSRLQGFIDGQHGNTLLAMLRVCQQSHHLFNSTKDASSKDCWSRIQEDLELVSRILKECTAKCIGNLTAGSEEKTMFNGYVLEPLVLLVESFCCVTLITGVCSRFLQKLTRGRKARKKKPVPAQANEGVMPLKEFLCTLQSSMADLHTALVEVNIVQLSDDLLELDLVELDKETKSSIVSEIWEKLQTSYKKSVKEISELLHLKMKFAKSLQI